MIFYRNLREITFRLTNVIPERITFVSRGNTVYSVSYKRTNNFFFFWRIAGIILAEAIRSTSEHCPSSSLSVTNRTWFGIFLIRRKQNMTLCNKTYACIMPACVSLCKQKCQLSHHFPCLQR